MPDQSSKKALEARLLRITDSEALDADTATKPDAVEDIGTMSRPGS
jgi:hypothetical protein